MFFGLFIAAADNQKYLTTFITESQEDSLMYKPAICGICKNNVEVDGIILFTITSPYAHWACFDQLNRAQLKSVADIEAKFPAATIKGQNLKHIELFYWMEDQIINKGFSSIKAFHDAGNADQLKQIYQGALERIQESSQS